MNEFETALLRFFPAEKLDALQNVRIGIAGAGGLGSNCAQMLVRSGIKKIKIVDFDTIDFSNLNRQFYFYEQTGRTKAEAVRDNLLKINPDAEITALTLKIEESRVRELFADCDVVVEAFDKAECKKMIVEAYLNSGKLLVSASGLAGWGQSDRIRVHQIKKNFFLIGDLQTSIGPDTPPLAPCVHIAAAKQADVVLSYVLGAMGEGNEHAS